MPADFFPQGEIAVFVSIRSPIVGINFAFSAPVFRYLGTAVTSPRIDAAIVYKDYAGDKVAPGPFQKLLQTEQHLVTMVLNRVNHTTWNRLKTMGNFNTGSEVVRDVPAGKLVLGSLDVGLFLKPLLASAPTPVFNPTDAATGRLYYSATLLKWDEDAPSRVQELGVQFECNPLPKDHKLLLYSEKGSDFPNVDVE